MASALAIPSKTLGSVDSVQITILDLVSPLRTPCKINSMRETNVSLSAGFGAATGTGFGGSSGSLFGNSSNNQQTTPAFGSGGKKMSIYAGASLPSSIAFSMLVT